VLQAFWITPLPPPREHNSSRAADKDSFFDCLAILAISNLSSRVPSSLNRDLCSPGLPAFFT